MDLNKEIVEIFKKIKVGRDFPKAIEPLKALNLTDEELFLTLWPRSIQAQGVGKYVTLCAYSLYALSPNCTIPLKTALLQVCNKWDISIEEVPWYLVNQFSKEEILNLTQKMNFEDKNKNIRLKTIDYWINLKK